MEALGRLFNVIAVADGVLVPMKDHGGCTFVCFLAVGDTFTLQEAQDAAGTGAQDLVAITKTYQSNGVGGVWSKVTQAAAATVAITANDCAVIEIEASRMSTGFTHLKVTSTGAGTVVAIPRDLLTQRTPANLAALV